MASIFPTTVPGFSLPAPTTPTPLSPFQYNAPKPMQAPAPAPPPPPEPVKSPDQTFLEQNPQPKPLSQDELNQIYNDAYSSAGSVLAYGGRPPGIDSGALNTLSIPQLQNIAANAAVARAQGDYQNQLKTWQNRQSQFIQDAAFNALSADEQRARLQNELKSSTSLGQSGQPGTSFNPAAILNESDRARASYATGYGSPLEYNPVGGQTSNPLAPSFTPTPGQSAAYQSNLAALGAEGVSASKAPSSALMDQIFAANLSAGLNVSRQTLDIYRYPTSGDETVRTTSSGPSGTGGFASPSARNEALYGPAGFASGIESSFGQLFAGANAVQGEALSGGRVRLRLLPEFRAGQSEFEKEVQETAAMYPYTRAEKVSDLEYILYPAAPESASSGSNAPAQRSSISTIISEPVQMQTAEGEPVVRSSRSLQLPSFLGGGQFLTGFGEAPTELVPYGPRQLAVVPSTRIIQTSAGPVEVPITGPRIVYNGLDFTETMGPTLPDQYAPVLTSRGIITPRPTLLLDILPGTGAANPMAPTSQTLSTLNPRLSGRTDFGLPTEPTRYAGVPVSELALQGLPADVATQLRGTTVYPQNALEAAQARVQTLGPFGAKYVGAGGGMNYDEILAAQGAQQFENMKLKSGQTSEPGTIGDLVQFGRITVEGAGIGLANQAARAQNVVLQGSEGPFLFANPNISDEQFRQAGSNYGQALDVFRPGSFGQGVATTGAVVVATGALGPVAGTAARSAALAGGATAAEAAATGASVSNLVGQGLLYGGAAAMGSQTGQLYDKEGRPYFSVPAAAAGAATVLGGAALLNALQEKPQTVRVEVKPPEGLFQYEDVSQANVRPRLYIEDVQPRGPVPAQPSSEMGVVQGRLYRGEGEIPGVPGGADFVASLAKEGEGSITRSITGINIGGRQIRLPSPIAVQSEPFTINEVGTLTGQTFSPPSLLSRGPFGNEEVRLVGALGQEVSQPIQPIQYSGRLLFTPTEGGFAASSPLPSSTLLRLQPGQTGIAAELPGMQAGTPNDLFQTFGGYNRPPEFQPPTSVRLEPLRIGEISQSALQSTPPYVNPDLVAVYEPGVYQGGGQTYTANPELFRLIAEPGRPLSVVSYPFGEPSPFSVSVRSISGIGQAPPTSAADAQLADIIRSPSGIYTRFEGQGTTVGTTPRGPITGTTNVLGEIFDPFATGARPEAVPRELVFPSGAPRGPSILSGGPSAPGPGGLPPVLNEFGLPAPSFASSTSAGTGGARIVPSGGPQSLGAQLEALVSEEARSLGTTASASAASRAATSTAQRLAAPSLTLEVPLPAPTPLAGLALAGQVQVPRTRQAQGGGLPALMARSPAPQIEVQRIVPDTVQVLRFSPAVRQDQAGLLNQGELPRSLTGQASQTGQLQNQQVVRIMSQVPVEITRPSEITIPRILQDTGAITRTVDTQTPITRIITETTPTTATPNPPTITVPRTPPPPPPWIPRGKPPLTLDTSARGGFAGGRSRTKKGKPKRIGVLPDLISLAASQYYFGSGRALVPAKNPIVFRNTTALSGAVPTSEILKALRQRGASRAKRFK